MEWLPAALIMGSSLRGCQRGLFIGGQIIFRPLSALLQGLARVAGTMWHLVL